MTHLAARPSARPTAQCRSRLAAGLFLSVWMGLFSVLCGAAPSGATPMPVQDGGETASAETVAEAATVARRRAAELFRSGEAGELELEAAFVLQALVPGSQQGLLQILLWPDEPIAAGARYRLALVVEDRDGTLSVRQRAATAEDAVPAETAWLYETPARLGLDAAELVVVVENLDTGRWGAAVGEIVEEPMERPAGVRRTVSSTDWSAPVRPPKGGQVAGSGEAEELGETRGTIVRLLPPRGRRLQGSTQIETLVSTADVTRVDFFLDGRQVGSRDKRPFELRVDLAGPDRRQEVEVVAFAGAGDELGRDRLIVNEPRRPFRIRLGALAPAGEGSLRLEAEVSVPPARRLDRVEIFLNETRLERLDAPPFAATVPADAQGYVQAVAYLADGESVEDVRLLGAAGVSEEVEVNLVELFLVVTDRDGNPVPGLQAGDFRVRQGGRTRSIERLTFAEDVPLVLGLVIDTSESMMFMIEETKRAATQFLGRTVREDDRVFLVEFDSFPRLLQRTTGDVEAVIRGFRRFVADGYTALYDSMLYSLAEFSGGRGRKALVLRTDGDDFQSEFGPNRAIRYARDTGVPIYIVGLGGREQLRGSTVLELEAVTEETGGRLFFADTPQELSAAYDRINRELRSQYLLTFYSDQELGADERDGIKVSVEGRGREVRTVVSPD